MNDDKQGRQYGAVGTFAGLGKTFDPRKDDLIPQDIAADYLKKLHERIDNAADFVERANAEMELQRLRVQTEKNIKAVEETRRIMATHLDKLWAHYRFDNYQQPGGYETLDDISSALVSNVTDVTYRALAGGDEWVNNSVPLAVLGASLVWKGAGMCTYYVNRDLAHALAMTDAPATMPLRELRWPREGMMFLPPRGAFVSPLGSEVVAVMISRAKEGGEFVLPTAVWPHGFSITPPDGLSAIGIAAIIRDKGLADLKDRAYWTVEHPMTERAMIGDLFDVVTNNDIGDMESEPYYERITHFAVNAMLLMTEQPELVEPRRLLKSVRSKRDGTTVQWWSPRWLAPKYVIKRESMGGSHASPRMHWRNGHWRNQIMGPKDERSHKRIWIEPVLVNAKAGA